MTPDELCQLTPESTTTDTRWLAGYYYNHVPELVCGADAVQYIDDDAATVVVEGVTLDVLKHITRNADGAQIEPGTDRRFWRLAIVRLDSLPVMVVRNDGREGDDYADRYVFSAERYLSLLERLCTHPKWERVQDKVCVSGRFEPTTAYGSYGPEGSLDKAETFAGRSLGECT